MDRNQWIGYEEIERKSKITKILGLSNWIANGGIYRSGAEWKWYSRHSGWELTLCFELIMLQFPLDQHEDMSHLNLRESLTYTWYLKLLKCAAQLQIVYKWEGERTPQSPWECYNIHLHAARQSSGGNGGERNAFNRQRGRPVQTQRHTCSFHLNTEGMPGTSRGLVSLGWWEVKLDCVSWKENMKNRGQG